MSDHRTDTACVVCGDEIEGDVMIPENDGPMHPSCWVDWVGEGDPDGE